MNEIILKIEGLDGLTSAINRLAAATSAAAGAPLGNPGFQAESGHGSETEPNDTDADELAQQRAKKEAEFAEGQKAQQARDLAEQEAAEKGITDEKPKDGKPAGRTTFFITPQGFPLRIEKGEPLPPHVPGWKKIKSEDFDVAMKKLEDAENEKAGLDMPTSGGPVDTEDGNPGIEDDGPMDKAKFKALVMAFGKGDPTRARGNALVAHFGVDKLGSIPESYWDDVADLIRRAAAHFSGGNPAAIPETANENILAKIDKLPGKVEAKTDDETDW